MDEMLQMDLPALCFDEPMDLDFEIEIREVANMDDRPGFVALMKSIYGEQLPKLDTLEKYVPENIGATYCPPDVFEFVCLYDAVNCTTALLEGDPFIVDPNVPFKFGLYPLHIAAEDFSYNMVDLLLRHGAWTNVRTIEGEYRGDLLPLNIALEMLSYHRYLSDWTPKKSIFKLIVILSLPQMKVPLETNRLLAWNTKDVSNIFNHYAMEGILIPMAALLMVAREKIMAPSTLQSKDVSGLEGGMMIRRCILKEIALLTNEEVELMCSGKDGDRRFKNKKAAMTNALLLLDVFDRAGDAIETYRQSVRYHMSKEKVVKDIKALLEELGFIVKDKDIDLSDIDCENEDIKLATEVLEKRTSFRSKFQDLCMPLHSQSHSFCQTKESGFVVKDKDIDLSDRDCENEDLKLATEVLEKRTSCRSQFQDLRLPLHSQSHSFCQTEDPITNIINEQIWAISKFIEWGSPVLSPERPYRTFKLMEGDSTGFPFYRLPIEKKRGRAMKIPASFFLNLEHFTSFGLAIKRGLTRI